MDDSDQEYYSGLAGLIMRKLNDSWRKSYYAHFELIDEYHSRRFTVLDYIRAFGWLLVQKYGACFAILAHDYDDSGQCARYDLDPLFTHSDPLFAHSDLFNDPKISERKSVLVQYDLVCDYQCKSISVFIGMLEGKLTFYIENVTYIYDEFEYHTIAFTNPDADFEPKLGNYAVGTATLNIYPYEQIDANIRQIANYSARTHLDDKSRLKFAKKIYDIVPDIHFLFFNPPKCDIA